jgi:hypothetical protein
VILTGVALISSAQRKPVAAAQRAGEKEKETPAQGTGPASFEAQEVAEAAEVCASR